MDFAKPGQAFNGGALEAPSSVSFDQKDSWLKPRFPNQRALACWIGRVGLGRSRLGSALQWLLPAVADLQTT